MKRERVKSRALSGQRFGRWLVLNDYIKTKKGEIKWLCRCACGTERYVLERVLVRGDSRSCGCLRLENSIKALSYDLAGRIFGELTVICKLEKEHRSRGVWWLCECSCGNLCEVPATLLVTGKKIHCGCRANAGHPYKDIAGRRFHRIVALYPTDGRTSGGSVIWHCRCDCGNVIDVSHNELEYGNIKSCGCQKREHNQKLKGYRELVDGTSVDMIRSTKLPSNNTTGYKGVYVIRGKYAAKIVFQQKAYYLGTFEKIEDAIRERRKAEEILFVGTAAFYDRWKAKAKADPEWAKENPVRIQVTKDAAAGLKIFFKPEF